MKILKSLFFFISIYAALVGCSKKDDPVAQGCSLNAFTYVSGTTTITNTYTYDNNKVVAVLSSSSGITTTINYNYDSQGKVTSVTSTLNISGASPYTKTYSYNAQGNLAQAVSSVAKTVYTYNSSNQMVKRELYNNTNSTYTLSSYSIYSYPSTDTKNYATQLDYDSSGKLQITVTYVYDTKQSPQVLLFPTFPEPTSNVIQQTSQFPSGPPPPVVTYTYTYNDSGFPLTAKDSGNTYTTTYTYTNCK